MSKVLVTGAAGFVGRHLTRRLLDLGDEVHAVDRIVPLTGGIHPKDGWPLFEPRDHAGFRFHEMDCRDFFERDDARDFDWAFHAAAVVGGRAMIENDPLAVAEDLALDALYWKWASRTRPARTVTFSSSAAYPVHLQRREAHRLLREDMIAFDGERPLGLPDMTYGWAKLTSEFLGRLAHERHGLRSIAYRPFSGFGEDQDLSYPFPSICQRALANRGAPRLSVWGSGEQLRDFIYIEDCMDAIFLTRDRIEDGDALNLSTGVYTSFKSLARQIAGACGYEPEIVGEDDKPSGVFARGGDTEKQRSLGFVATTPLAEAIEKALRFLEPRMP